MRTSTRTRQLVRMRSGNLCELCGTPGVLQDHHRRPRGMGGSSDRVSDKPSNLLRVHVACHNKIESNRREALRNGWLVSQRWDPATIPLLRRGQWCLLGDVGEVIPTEEPHDKVDSFTSP